MDSFFFTHLVPTAAPENLTGSATSSMSIFLSWSSPPSELLNGILRGYQIYVVEEQTSRNFTVHSSDDQYILFSLHPHYTYVFSVAATTVGSGSFSKNITVDTQQDGKLIGYISLSFYLSYQIAIEGNILGKFPRMQFLKNHLLLAKH